MTFSLWVFMFFTIVRMWFEGLKYLKGLGSLCVGWMFFLSLLRAWLRSWRELGLGVFMTKLAQILRILE
ncbi:hypothetical protein CXG53_24185 [Pseudomonas guariconensis]|uniref:Uncharacterized protein n=1 Tax=Pseudomonas guariconensis TaxID=1288410 RepID=A0AAX0VR59_9PSED|nr:hypothetical protein CXG49_24100 [Pseudomonas guariconensis]PLV21583.1 hypothetical protein CXG53_24185 [Pseudomonas guariconensis]PLV26726.1 hypothetical protein CXG51_24340 [Pseudomonas guariconensis]